MNMPNRWIPNYENEYPRPIFRKLTWKEWFLRLFRKSYVQSITHCKNGMIIIGADNPSPSLHKTKLKEIHK